MPINFRDHPDDWASHKTQVKSARGSVCYGALAAHFGTDSPKALEWRVDGRSPYDCHGDQSISNKYLRWRQGKALPHDDSVNHVLVRTAGAVQLGFWRDMPLWELLTYDVPPMSHIIRLLEEAPVNIRRILFFDHQPNQFGRFHHTEPTRTQILGIRNLYSLDAFIVLLCLARKGEALENDTQHFLPSACAFDILPRILYSNRPLRYRWENLFACIQRLFWNRVYLNGLYYKFSIETVRNSLTQLDADPSARLLNMSGNRLKPAINDPLQSKIN